MQSAASIGLVIKEMLCPSSVFGGSARFASSRDRERCDWADRSAERGGLALAELLVGRPPDPPALFRQAQKTTLAHFSA